VHQLDFFAVIGISLGFSDPVTAQYVGFVLHVITGMAAAGNVFGQVSLFWSKLAPYDAKAGLVKRMIVGIALWAVLLVPLATLGIQQRLDSYAFTAPNQYVYNISDHFQGLYFIIIGGSLAFHLIYGALAGFISGRMAEIGIFVKVRNNVIVKP
jgi:Na+/proline symporter